MQPPNPYESPPSPSRPVPTWSEWLWSWLWQPTDTERFLSGTRAWHYGVAFRVDPHDDTILVASLPLAIDDEVRVQRNVAEAQRVLHEFLGIHPDVAPQLRTRNLIVAMIRSYTDFDDEIRRVYVPAAEWNRFAAADLPVPRAGGPAARPRWSPRSEN